MNKPELFAFTRRAQVDAAASESMLSKAGSAQLGNTTKHWKTNLQHANETQMSQPVSVSQRPVWSYPRQAYSSKRSFF